MYEVHDMASHWELHTPEQNFHGTFMFIMALCMKLGFSSKELDFAVTQMVRSEHNAIHFGMYKTLIYTFNREEENAKRKAQ